MLVQDIVRVTTACEALALAYHTASPSGIQCSSLVQGLGAKKSLELEQTYFVWTGSPKSNPVISINLNHFRGNPERSR